MVTQALAQRPEHFGRGGEIEHADAVGLITQKRGERVEAFVTERVGLEVMQAFQKALCASPLRIVVNVAFQFQCAARAIPERGRVLLRPCRTDDARTRRNLAGEIAVEQRRQQLAAREVAGRAEHHEIEGFHRNDSGAHGRRAVQEKRLEDANAMLAG